MEGKPIGASRVALSTFMQPEHANARGNVHGGWIMKLADEAGGLAAIRHARKSCVTVAIDNMTFREPVHIGDLLTLNAELTWVGRTSMEVEVKVTAENPLTGEQTHTNTAHIVYVAIDERERPAPVPPLVAETDAERARMEAARERQAYRLRQRNQAGA
ncbi:MAG: acyl-CoA thioesterase [Chloroflexi bacterium]|nr:acyl-CoA thioesterase [Chloroflexota bacterium]